MDKVTLCYISLILLAIVVAITLILTHRKDMFLYDPRSDDRTFIYDPKQTDSLVKQKLLAQCADCYGKSYDDTPESRKMLFVESCIKFGFTDDVGRKFFDIYIGKASVTSLSTSEREQYKNVTSEVDGLLQPSNCHTLEGGKACIFGDAVHGIKTQNSCTQCARLKQGQGFLDSKRSNAVI